MKLQEYLEKKDPNLQSIVDVLGDDEVSDDDKVKALGFFAQQHRALGAKHVLDEVKNRVEQSTENNQDEK